MEKQYQTKMVASLPFSIEFFGINGSANLQGDQSVVMTKIITSTGQTNWSLLHNN